MALSNKVSEALFEFNVHAILTLGSQYRWEVAVRSPHTLLQYADALPPPPQVYAVLPDGESILSSFQRLRTPRLILDLRQVYLQRLDLQQLRVGIN